MSDSRFQITFPVLLILAIGFCVPAQADLIIGFSDDGGNQFVDTVDVQVGESKAISIFLRQTEGETVLTAEGIVSWGMDLSANPFLGTISNPSPNTAQFDSENHNVTTATGFEWEFGDGTGAGVTGDSILLGSFDFRATTAGTSLFTIEDRLIGTGVGNASWITPGFGILDEEIFGAGATGTYQLTINATTAIPEPNSIGLLIGLALVSIHRRRRNA